MPIEFGIHQHLSVSHRCVVLEVMGQLVLQENLAFTLSTIEQSPLLRSCTLVSRSIGLDTTRWNQQEADAGHRGSRDEDSGEEGSEIG